jgi:hypothetical protein
MFVSHTRHLHKLTKSKKDEEHSECKDFYNLFTKGSKKATTKALQNPIVKALWKPLIWGKIKFGKVPSTRGYLRSWEPLIELLVELVVEVPDWYNPQYGELFKNHQQSPKLKAYRYK